MSKRNGGSAFPSVIPNVGVEFDVGMTLRDYFAAMTLAGIAEQPGESCDGYIAQRVRVAYAIADAMLKERARSE